MFAAILIATVICLVYWLAIRSQRYWKDRGVVYTPSWPLFGNMASVFFRRKSFVYLIKDLYDEEPKKRYNGMMQFVTPVLLVRDLELIKQITVKDFDHFTDHNNFTSDDSDPLMGKNLFSLKGQKWRDMRSTLSPAFTSSKMRAMFNLMAECAEHCTNDFFRKNEKIMNVEMKDIFTRYTNDVIASTVFGIKCDSLGDRTNEFYTMGKETTRLDGFTGFRVFVLALFPKLKKMLKIPMFPARVTSFFRRIVKDTIAVRLKHGTIRPDMIHLLMEARKGRLKHEEVNGIKDAGFATVEESQIEKTERLQKGEITDDDIAAHALLFFFAGFDTAATLMCFIAHELGVNPDIQEKLQEEIRQTFENCNGKLTYERISEMKYLDMIVSETLRKWPPGFQLDRLCVKDYQIEPVSKDESPLMMEKGSVIIIPVYGIHHDPQYFPNPDKFDPERFSEENKQTIIPYSYLPFGSGPRNCIGSRFALLEVKVIFIFLLSKFDIVVAEKTKIPLKVDTGFNLGLVGGFWLGLKKRE